MKAIILALLTAAAWGFGGYFEKRGLNMGNLPPQLGITIRTAVALVILGAVSAPHWKTLGQAGTKPLLYMVIGGGASTGLAERVERAVNMKSIIKKTGVGAIDCDGSGRHHE